MRLEIFLNFLKLDDTFEEKAIALYEKAKKKPIWLYSELIKFSKYQKTCVKMVKYLNLQFQIILRPSDFLNNE